MLVAAGAAMLFGGLASAQAAIAAPYVAYAHFTKPSANFYAGYGDLIDISVRNSPTKTMACVSRVCRTFEGGEIHYAGPLFQLFFAHGQSRLVEIYACNSACMPAVWSRQLVVP